MAELISGKPRTQRRKFRMHPKLLMDVIRRQAGSLAKAVLEAVMNAIDAKATSCHVKIRPKRILISDDGSGILTLEHIEKFFEVFGQPHEENENKTYGVFRMGRGQMFSFGVNTWRTGSFKMSVDVKNHGLDYDLQDGLEEVKGCTVAIELYDPLLPGDVAELERTLEKWVRFAQIPVLINGKDVTVNPEDLDWDHMTDEAFVKLTDTGSLAVYNLGVHCFDIGSYRYGSGGTVVSRRQLKVNFARNDVQHDCPVWKEIKAVIDQRTRSDLARSKSLNDSQRQRLIDLITQDEAPPGIAKQKLFATVSGRHYSADEICAAAYRYHNKATTCKKGNQIGDRIMQSRAAFVFAEECLTKFRCTLPELLETIKKLTRTTRDAMPTVVPFETVAAGLHDRTELVKDQDLSVTEALWIGLARSAAGYICTGTGGRGSDYYIRRRAIVVGDSDAFDGWTDGSTYIALDRKFLGRLTLDVRGLTELAMVILHEYCHPEPDTSTHTHDHEFYQNYHDRSHAAVGEFVHAALKNLPGRLKTLNRRLAKQALQNLDKVELARRELAALASSTEAGPQPVADPVDDPDVDPDIDDDPDDSGIDDDPDQETQLG